MMQSKKQNAWRKVNKTMAEKDKIQLDVVTPEELIYSGKIDFLEGPAMDGLIGILPNHAPLVTGMTIGIVRIVNEDSETEIAISNGFMEVLPEKISLVVRTAELPDMIDIERAEAAKKRAEEKMEKTSDRVEFAKAEAAYDRAVARLKAAGHHDHGYDRL
jgi:F-type H+-transporting ATPase subunit epsilon